MPVRLWIEGSTIKQTERKRQRIVHRKLYRREREKGTFAANVPQSAARITVNRLLSYCLVTISVLLKPNVAPVPSQKSIFAAN